MRKWVPTLVLVALVVYYFVVRPVNVLMERFKTSTDDATETQTCPECKSSIPSDATRCAFCTVVLPTVKVPVPAPESPRSVPPLTTKPAR